MADGRPVVVVVGAGVAGLAAAWELTGGVDPAPDAPAVVVLDAAERPGGKLRSTTFAGTGIDVGPDGFLGRRPEAERLCRELGLDDALAPIGASGAAVWVGGRTRPLPPGLGLGVPTRFLPVARSGILGPAGAARLLLDVVAPRPDRRGPLGDRAIGPLVAHKLGRRVVTRLVDPLLGGIHAGGVADASAAAVYPGLLAAAQRHGSLMRSLRRSAPAAPPSPPGGAAPTEVADRPPPAFWALQGGMGVLVDRLVAALAGRGVTVRTGTRATALEQAPGGTGWVVHTPTGTLAADGLVLATPAAATAHLLERHDVEAANLLRSVEYASVAVVTMAFPTDAMPPHLFGTGLLVPAGTRLPAALADRLAGARLGDATRGDGQFLVTACTYLSAKWPHLAAEGRALVRASVGRFGDDRFTHLDDGQLGERVAAEVALLLGATAVPEEVLVTRWPDALPQYRVHHLLRVAGVEAAVERLPALVVAGAAYHGVGIPACIAGGRQAAHLLARRMGVVAEPA